MRGGINEFFGFGYSGTGSAEGFSSAIIVNGRSSVLKAEQLAKFVVAGRAYIDFVNDSSITYTTADSLSLRGIQEIYLVPTAYMYKIGGGVVTNPTEDPVVQVDLDEFFAYELLVAENPYNIVNLDGVYYYYLNFKSYTAQKEYVY